MDNHHVSMAGSQASCGVAELFGITADSKKVLYTIATRLYHPARGEPFAFLMWSDVVPESNGVLLWKEIRNTFRDDELSGSEVADNPKTGNEIQVWLWQIPHGIFKAWYIKERIKRAKKL